MPFFCRPVKSLQGHYGRIKTHQTGCAGAAAQLPEGCQCGLYHYHQAGEESCKPFIADIVVSTSPMASRRAAMNGRLSIVGAQFDDEIRVDGFKIRPVAVKISPP